MGSESVLCASAMCGFGTSLFTAVTLRCVPGVGHILRVSSRGVGVRVGSFSVLVGSWCLVRQRISLLYRDREA